MAICIRFLFSLLIYVISFSILWLSEILYLANVWKLSETRLWILIFIHINGLRVLLSVPKYVVHPTGSSLVRCVSQFLVPDLCVKTIPGSFDAFDAYLNVMLWLCFLCPLHKYFSHNHEKYEYFFFSFPEPNFQMT